MRQTIDRIIELYGMAVALQRKEGELPFRAFFQPVRSKSWQYLEGNYSPLGEIPRGQYVYLGPVVPNVSVGDILKVNGKFYRMRRTEYVYDSSEPVYLWGMCVEKGGEDTWGQS